MHRGTLPVAVSLALAGALLVADAAAAQRVSYDLDTAHSEVGFVVRHMMVTNVRGRFHGYKGKVELNDKNPEDLVLDIEIDASTIDTANKKRDDHLRSGDFFETEKHPTLRFVSKKTKRVEKNKFEIEGDLTIRGVTKPVTLVAEGFEDVIKDPFGNLRRGGTVTAKISRKEFGLNWNRAIEGGGVVVSDEVRIVLDVQLTRKAS